MASAGRSPPVAPESGARDWPNLNPAPSITLSARLSEPFGSIRAPTSVVSVADRMRALAASADYHISKSVPARQSSTARRPVEHSPGAWHCFSARHFWLTMFIRIARSASAVGGAESDGRTSARAGPPLAICRRDRKLHDRGGAALARLGAHPHTLVLWLGLVRGAAIRREGSSLSIQFEGRREKFQQKIQSHDHSGFVIVRPTLKLPSACFSWLSSQSSSSSCTPIYSRSQAEDEVRRPAGSGASPAANSRISMAKIVATMRFIVRSAAGAGNERC
jgi:hypothetical protein